MDDKINDMNKDMVQDSEAMPENSKEEPREVHDKTLEGIAGGSMPIIDAF